MEAELHEILHFWQQHTIDAQYGGFYGRLDNENNIIKDAPKGAVLNSRILWTFSSAKLLTNDDAYFQTAQRAFQYIKDYFIDREYGGVYWTVDFLGNPLDTKKQMYAVAFAMYGMSEYYRCSKNEEALEIAIGLYKDIVKYSYDDKYGGYFEAFGRDWKPLIDLRLSEKDENEKKSMNTHLHILEAFANLYKAWPDEMLKKRIQELLEIFDTHIIDNNTHHLHLFFDEEWTVKSNIVSFGHDIEAAWLLQEAAEVIEDKDLIAKFKMEALAMANSVKSGIGNDNGLWYEYDLNKQHLIKEKHWWPQAEAMVGFFNAWQISRDEHYLKQSILTWRFIQNHIKDNKNGEWYWGIKEDNTMMDEDKVGLWKCPYHNSRACIELIKRMSSLHKIFE